MWEERAALNKLSRWWVNVMSEWLVEKIECKILGKKPKSNCRCEKQ